MAEEAIYYGTGRRKTSVARVRVKPGTGIVTVNGKAAQDYFGHAPLMTLVEQPFKATETVGRFDVVAKIHGGGVAGQAGALRLAIARALAEHDPEWRTPLKQAGFLTRDPRMKERKKYGLKKARKRPQFSKR